METLKLYTRRGSVTSLGARPHRLHQCQAETIRLVTQQRDANFTRGELTVSLDETALER